MKNEIRHMKTVSVFLLATFLLTSLFSLISLAGCGKKGPLYHPEHTTKQAPNSDQE